MIFKGLVLKFFIYEDESLLPLVAGHGYSQPTKEDPKAKKVLTDGAAIEVRRQDKTTCMVAVFPGDSGSIMQPLSVALKDLDESGLITKPQE